MYVDIAWGRVLASSLADTFTARSRLLLLVTEESKMINLQSLTRSNLLPI